MRSEEIIETLVRAMIDRYGANALDVAEQQSEHGALPTVTWQAIIEMLRKLQK